MSGFTLPDWMNFVHKTVDYVNSLNDFIFLYYCIILISTAKSFKIKIEVNFLYAFGPGLGDSMQGLGFRPGLG